MDVFNGIPSEFLPAIGTSEYKALQLLSDRQSHPKIEFLTLLGDCPRSVFQRLWGERFEFWNIRNIGVSKGVYVLDERHLSGDLKLDAQARSEAKVEYRKRSKSQSECGAKHLPKAREELALAKREAEQQRELNFTDT
tara:strand:- start:64 stop:477 length:414 start_codon:yes stop_codon:yes gene_type:complete